MMMDQDNATTHPRSPTASHVSTPPISISSRASSPMLINPHTIKVTNPMSPCTIKAILKGYQSINAITLQTICQALANMLRECENNYRVTNHTLSEQVDQLATQVLKYEKTFNHPPEGY